MTYYDHDVALVMTVKIIYNFVQSAVGVIEIIRPVFVGLHVINIIPLDILQTKKQTIWSQLYFPCRYEPELFIHIHVTNLEIQRDRMKHTHTDR